MSPLKFLKTKTRRYLVDAGKYKEFTKRFREILKDTSGHGEYTAWILACKEFPESRLTQVLSERKKQKDHLSRARQKNKIARIDKKLRKVPPAEAAVRILDRSIVEQIGEEKRAMGVQERRAKMSEAKAKNKVLKKKMETERARAEAVLAKAEAEDSKRIERERKAAREEAERLSQIPSVALDQPIMDVNVLADIRWVYYNLVRLIQTDPSGNTSLNEEILKEAPSNGAIEFAYYALRSRENFIEKFVSKLLVGDLKDPEKSKKEDENKEEDLDPDLSGLSHYFEGQQ